MGGAPATTSQGPGSRFHDEVDRASEEANQETASGAAEPPASRDEFMAKVAEAVNECPVAGEALRAKRDPPHPEGVGDQGQ